jgi:hypothetical protein
VAGFDITEGRPNYSIAVDIGILEGATWQNNGYDYDCALNGLPFLMAQSNDHAYERGTNPFRKQQYDSQRDPGEQSLTGWWLRSQSSFHAGSGILYYDPFANPFSTTLASNSYRFNTSFGLNTFTFGQVTLLNRMKNIKSTTAASRILPYHAPDGSDYVLMLDSNIYKLTGAGTSTTLVSATSTIHSFTSDGANVYYLDDGHFVQKNIESGTSTNMYNAPSSITSSTMQWVKQRLVAGVNNAIYEVVGTGTSISPVYTHPNANWKWTDIDEAGPAIYAAGYSGANSAIYMFTLTSSGSMPVLTAGILAAQLPDGEIIYSISSYLGTYMMIGTNKGVRVGQVDQATGYITYGPLLVETNTPVRGFVGRDSYVWFGSSVTDGEDYYCGTFRIDLSSEVLTLTYPIQQDVYAENTYGTVYDVSFLGNTNQLTFIASTNADTASSLGWWVESATELLPTGYLQTGYIRYNTLEPKNFKRVAVRGDYGVTPTSSNPTGKSKGSMTVSSVDFQGNIYEILSYDYTIGTPEGYITQPFGAQDAIALRFDLYRDATDITLSPVFTGYQIKAVPATPRTRLIKVPLLNFDTEQDKYNGVIGWEGRAWQRLAQLEQIEANGDIINFQDFRTGETVQVLIEDITFRNITPPDKRLTGFGGIMVVTIRTV